MSNRRKPTRTPGVQIPGGCNQCSAYRSYVSGQREPVTRHAEGCPATAGGQSLLVFGRKPSRR